MVCLVVDVLQCHYSQSATGALKMACLNLRRCLPRRLTVASPPTVRQLAALQAVLGGTLVLASVSPARQLGGYARTIGTVVDLATAPNIARHMMLQVLGVL